MKGILNKKIKPIFDLGFSRHTPTENLKMKGKTKKLW